VKQVKEERNGGNDNAYDSEEDDTPAGKGE